MRKIAFATMFSVAAGLASAAQAQTALGNGVSFTSISSSPASPGTTAVDLGDYGSGTSLTLVTRMPLSLSYGGVDVGITFSGGAGLYDGGLGAPTSGNYLMATSTGNVTLEFSQAQTYFETRWGSVDSVNALSFYNGSQLLGTVSGTQLSSSAPTLAFEFAELGYDRVVASTTSGGMEFGGIRFGGPAPEVAPLPLGSAGIAFLGMMGARRRGLSWRDAMREANPLRKMREARAA